VTHRVLAREVKRPSPADFYIINPNPDKPEIRKSKYEIRNKSENPKFKCLKRHYRREKVEFNSNIFVDACLIVLYRDANKFFAQFAQN